MATDRYTKLSRAQLLAELRRLESVIVDRKELASLLHEQRVQTDEIEAQQRALLEAQIALESSRDRYVDLFDFAPVGFASLDRNGLVEEINLRATVMVEQERNRVLGMPFVLFVQRDDRRRFLDHMARCRRSTGEVETELSLTAKSGRVIPVHLASRPSHEGTVHRYQTAFIDLTERRLAEVERERNLREEQAARAASDAKDRFLATLSHELRTPLAPILYALATLDAQGEVPERLLPVVELIRRNIHLEARLIDDLLDVTRIIQGKLSLELDVVDLHEVLADVERLCLQTHDAQSRMVRLEPEARRHHVRGDPTRLRQIFWNLERNAIQATPPGGRITIRTSSNRRGTLKVTVEDTGVGIASVHLGRLFEPFEQVSVGAAKNPGLGLGLSIAKGLVAAHGGTIAARSRGPGRGATFVVELPTTGEQRRAKASPRAAAGQRPTLRASVLIVEDNEDNAVALAEFLGMHGYHVEVAGSVRAALEQANGRFDVVVSDLGLPDGSGLDLMRQLRATRPIRGIAVSGFGTDDDVRRSAEAGFDLHLTKPVDPIRLVEAIERLSARAQVS